MGHGSRDAEGAREFLTFAERLSARLARPIYAGFLELADPPIVSAIDEAVKAGAKSIVAVPWFLLGAGHVKNDVPTALQWASQRYPQVVIRYGNPINVQPEILAILGERLAAIDPDNGVGSHKTAVLLVQRGSSDPEANADVYRVARFLWEGRKYSTVEVAFSGVARPSIAEGLQRCLKYDPQCVLVVPYYLYTGILVERISTVVAEVAVMYSECEFRVASHFGQDTRLDRLAQHMIEQIRNGKATMTCDMCQYRVPLFGREFLVKAPQVSDLSHGLRGTTMSENTEADHAHTHNYAHHDGHIHSHEHHDDHTHSHEHHHSHTSDLKDRWDALRECVVAAGITNRQEITDALTIWQSKSRVGAAQGMGLMQGTGSAQGTTPTPYILTAPLGHVPTAALRWDWDGRRAHEFARWCMEALQGSFGVSWQVDCEVLQYPATDRGNDENLMSLPLPPSMADASRTIPYMSSDFTLVPQYLLMTLGERQERCDWRYLNQNRWMGAFCTIADRLLRPIGVTALSLETGWFDTVVVFCRSDYAEEILRWFPEAE
jgi:sirohydrochlorin cobaltochelatase